MNSLPILIVGSNIDEVVAQEKHLRSIGIGNEVVCVDSAENAISFIDNCNRIPSLIILDLNLHGRGWLQLLKELKKKACLFSVPIIAISDSDDESEWIDSYTNGASGYLKKPLNNYTNALEQTIINSGLRFYIG